MDKKINITKVLSTFDKAMDNLEEGLQPETLTKEALGNIDKELESVIRLGLKVKLQYQQRKIEGLIQSLEGNQIVDLNQIQQVSNEIQKILNIADKVA